MSVQLRWRGSCARPGLDGDGFRVCAGTMAVRSIPVVCGRPALLVESEGRGGNTRGPERDSFSRRRAGASDDFDDFTVTDAAVSPRMACKSALKQGHTLNWSSCARKRTAQAHDTYSQSAMVVIIIVDRHYGCTEMPEKRKTAISTTRGQRAQGAIPRVSISVHKCHSQQV